MSLNVDQPCEHKAIDASTGEIYTFSIEPDRHGITIRFEHTKTYLVLDIDKEVLSIHCFEDDRDRVLALL